MLVEDAPASLEAHAWVLTPLLGRIITLLEVVGVERSWRALD